MGVEGTGTVTHFLEWRLVRFMKTSVWPISIHRGLYYLYEDLTLSVFNSKRSSSAGGRFLIALDALIHLIDTILSDSLIAGDLQRRRQIL